MKSNSMIAACIAVMCVPAHGASVAKANEKYVALFADVMVRPDGKHRPRLDLGYGADLRFGFHAEHRWGYEVRVFYGRLQPKDKSVATGNRSGAGADAVYRFPSLLGLQPYFLGGVGIAYSDKLPGRDWIAPYVDLGMGVSSGPLLRLWSRPLRLRAEARYAYEDYRDEYTGTNQFDRSNYLDLHAFVGLELSLDRPVPAPPPQLPKVVPAVPAAPAAVDSDGDGIPDNKDRCPDTPAGTPVDTNGCPIQNQ